MKALARSTLTTGKQSHIDILWEVPGRPDLRPCLRLQDCLISLFQTRNPKLKFLNPAPKSLIPCFLALLWNLHALLLKPTYCTLNPKGRRPARHACGAIWRICRCWGMVLDYGFRFEV